VPFGSPALWFVVSVYDEEQQQRYFVTTSASSTATVPLDIEAMTELTIEE
jgi:hypothetical protein